MHGEALGWKPEPISGIPPNVNGEQRLEEPLSLTVVSIYLGGGESGDFHPLCTPSSSVFSGLLF